MGSPNGDRKRRRNRREGRPLFNAILEGQKKNGFRADLEHRLLVNAVMIRHRLRNFGDRSGKLIASTYAGQIGAIHT